METESPVDTKAMSSEMRISRMSDHTFILFDAGSFRGAGDSINLPALGSGLCERPARRGTEDDQPAAPPSLTNITRPGSR